MVGISGNIEKGCWSVCLSGGYEDDVDLGDYFTYTGSGGRDLKGTADKPKNLRTAPQTKDQKFEGMNAALRRSVETKNPIRVIRGFKAKNKLYAPPTGYVYSGLYIVERAWMEKGLSGFKVCKYSFKRCPNQPRLPRFDPGGMEVVIVVPNLPTLSPKTREEEEEEEEEERTPPRRSERLSRVGIPNLEREKEEEEEGEDAFDVDLLL
ncbi:hypothetical protein IE53DRAFT_349750 [Violaceomyces palustris]|uniref:Uncharacterized protein n=1 Tax=Violaceomyces palustris TaxID=1673888 RepID=A0ACD0NMT0_9BASI|nr:hypothetical protein IE53DRAFT_349750 [Violaceomyces palustris]